MTDKPSEEQPPQRIETEWPECADLGVRTLPDSRLRSAAIREHRITRTRRRELPHAPYLSGWQCTCGAIERPRYADPDMAACAAERHLAAA